MNARGISASKLMAGTLAAAALVAGGCGGDRPSPSKPGSSLEGRTYPTIASRAGPGAGGAAAETADTGKARFWKPIDY